MLIIALVIVWIFGGIYCAIENWRKILNVRLGDLIILIIAGAIIGPFLGIEDCFEYLVSKIFEEDKIIWFKKEH